jgi:hypothetical protein
MLKHYGSLDSKEYSQCSIVYFGDQAIVLVSDEQMLLGDGKWPGELLASREGHNPEDQECVVLGDITR